MKPSAGKRKDSDLTHQVKDGLFPTENVNVESGLWPTPNATMFGGESNIDKTLERRKKYQEKYGNNGFGLTQGQAVATKAPAKGAQLNPDWVEFLMGWPIGWTSTEPLPRREFKRCFIAGARYWRRDPAERKGRFFVPRVAAGIKNRNARLKLTGNGVVPLQALPAVMMIKRMARTTLEAA